MATAAEREANLATIKSNLMPESASNRIPIIDSHIHLYPEGELSTLAWLTSSTPAELQGQHSLEEYTSDTEAPPELEGFIFLETDRKFDTEAAEASGFDGTGWEEPLMEIEWLKRIALGQPREGEGHNEEHKKLCLGIVPWAPMPSGVEALEKYMKLAEEKAGGAWDKILGFRYLVQDKPDGTMLATKFVESLRWLGKNGFVFDHGVDSHRGGEVQLKDSVKMIERVHDGVPVEDRTTFIINHLCKPDLTLIGDVTLDPKFQSWRESIFALSKQPNTYMKLSGLFSELPDSLKKESGDIIFEKIMPWLIVILTTFRGRLMFGSDWPVCTAGVGKQAWPKWRWIVERMTDLAGFSIEEKVMLWSGTAIKAYKIKELM